jgi:hypothetical protein
MVRRIEYAFNGNDAQPEKLVQGFQAGLLQSLWRKKTALFSSFGGHHRPLAPAAALRPSIYKNPAAAVGSDLNCPNHHSHCNHGNKNIRHSVVRGS